MPLSSPLRLPLRLGLTALAARRGGGGGPPVPEFDPATLFGVNDRGGIYDMTNSLNLFQLSGGTGSVALGDPVGYVADLGPIGRPALQATAASRPLWLGAPRTLGSELVTNGMFAADSDWTKGAGWTISGAAATKTAGTASVLSQSISLTAGKLYFVTYQITRTAGTVTARFTGGTTVAGISRSYRGSWVDELIAVTGNTTLEFSADSSFAGTVKNVTVKEVTSGVNHGARFDQVDDFLLTASIDFSNSDKATLAVLYTRGQSVSTGTVAQFGNYAGNAAGSLHAAAENQLAGVRGTAGPATASLAASEINRFAVSNYLRVLSIHEFDLAGATIADQVKTEYRGVNVANTSGGVSAAGGSFANSTLTLGKAFTSTWRMSGIIERVFIINRLLTTQEKSDVRQWLSRGAVLCAVLGDSTVASLASNVSLPQAMRVSGMVGGAICGGADVSKAGDRIADQKTAWTGLENKDALRAVFVQIGLNDCKGRVGNNTSTTAAVVADLQDLIDTINADKPSGCRVYVSGLTPCRAWIEDCPNPTAAYQAWLDVNQAIAGSGSTPITGVDGRVTSHVTALADGANNLAPEYDIDGVHENNAARFIIAQAWRAQLEADGLV